MIWSSAALEERENCKQGKELNAGMVDKKENLDLVINFIVK
jgi:hypothetical protein